MSLKMSVRATVIGEMAVFFFVGLLLRGMTTAVSEKERCPGAGGGEICGRQR
jgi:hypothetical protein